MNANDVRRFIDEHPQGIVIKMVDGTKYRVPHRDWVWMTPAFGGAESRFGRYATSLGVYHDEALRWINCLLISEMTPIVKRNGSNGNGQSRGKRGKPKRG